MPVAPLAAPNDRPIAAERGTAEAAKIGTAIASPAVGTPVRLSILAWLMLAWACGVLVLLARLVRSQLRFHRVVVRNAAALDFGRFPLDFAGLLRRSGLRRRVRIVESASISSPVVWGMFRPTLILPAGISSSLSAGQLEWVLLHELAHVRRRDLAVRCFQCLASIVHFVNPAIWIANRTINRLREYACDDMASALGSGSQLESGEAFLGVMRFSAAIQHRCETNLDGALGVFESTARASCFARMKRLLDGNRRIRARLGLGSICILLLTAALALPQIRAANPPAAEGKAGGGKATEKKEQPRSADAAKAATEKKKEAIPEIFDFSVVVAKHVMLLEGKEIITWPQIEVNIAQRPNPSLTRPHFYITRGAMEAGLFQVTKDMMWHLHGTYRLVGHGEGSLSPLAELRYDRIQSAADLKPDESLRINGSVIDGKGKPVGGADVILVTPIDESISYKTHTIYLVRGRVRNALEEVMFHANEQGRFSLYPPKGVNYFLIAIHRDGGIGFSGRDQFLYDKNKLHLLKWAGLVSVFGKDAEKQGASISTRIPPSGDIPEIVFEQFWGDLGDQPPTLRFGFTHVPPIFETSIARHFSEKDSGSIALPGASVALMEGETRRLDLGPLTEQQRQWLEQMRKNSEERQRESRERSKKVAPNDSKTSASQPTTKLESKPGEQAVAAGKAAEHGGGGFHLVRGSTTWMGSDGEPLQYDDYDKSCYAIWDPHTVILPMPAKGFWDFYGARTLSPGIGRMDISMVHPASEQPANITMPGAIDLPTYQLLLQPRVQRTLELSEEQRGKLLDISAKYWPERRRIAGKEMDEIEAAKHKELAAYSEKAGHGVVQSSHGPIGAENSPLSKEVVDKLERQWSDARKQIEDVLTTEQLRTLKDLTFRTFAFGSGAMFEPQVLQKLGVDKGTQDKLRTLESSLQQEKDRRLRGMTREKMKKMMAVLTAAQQSQIRRELSPEKDPDRDCANFPYPGLPSHMPDTGAAEVLGLSREQQERVRKIVTAHWMSRITIEAEKQKLPLGDEKGRKAVDEKRRQEMAGLRKKVEAVLTPAQWKLCQEIAMQNTVAIRLRHEAAAFFSPMGLTKKQCSALRAIEAEYFDKPEEIYCDLTDKALAAFTPAQREMLRAEVDRRGW
jgi:hypothetical protein